MLPVRSLAVLFVFACTLASIAIQDKAGPQATPEVAAFRARADVELKAFHLDEALKILEEGLLKARDLKDAQGEAQMIGDMGIVWHRKGDMNNALGYFVQAVDAYHRSGDSYNEAGYLMNVGVLNDNMGHPDKALEIYERVLIIFRESGKKLSEANTLQNIAIVYSNLDQHQRAFEYTNQALKLYTETNNTQGQGTCWNSIGDAYNVWGNLDEALVCFERARALYKSAGRRDWEAGSMDSIALILQRQGKVQAAMDLYQQALAIRQDAGIQRGEATSYAYIGGLYSALGQQAEAISYLKRSLELRRKLGNSRGEQSCLNDLGIAYTYTREFPKALESLNSALILARDHKDRQGEASVLCNLGGALRSKHDWDSALVRYKEALAILRDIGDDNGVASVLNGIGSVYYDRADHVNSERYMRQALEIYKRSTNYQYEANSLGNLAEVLAKQGKLAEADASYKKMMEISERNRAGMGGYSALKTGYVQMHQSQLHKYVLLLVRRGKTAEAFSVAQKTKARMLLDLLHDGSVDMRSVLSLADREREATLKKNSDSIASQMVKEGAENAEGAKKRYAALKLELQEADQKLQEFTDGLYARHPEVARKTVARTATLSDVVRHLMNDTALLEYMKTPDGWPILFVVTAQGGKAKVQSYTLKGKVNLAGSVNAFRSACSDPRKEYTTRSSILYRSLILPAEAALRGKTRLIICPDDVLWDLPFSALRASDGRFLGEKYAITNAYSATGAVAALSARKVNESNNGLLVCANPAFGTAKRFGDLKEVPGQRPIDVPSRPIDVPSRPIDIPTRPIDVPTRAIDLPSRMAGSMANGSLIAALPGTQREADSLRKLFPSARVLTGVNAQENTIKSVAGNYQYLHFATHGFVNDASPMLSSIVLSQPNNAEDDGFLTAREVYGLHLNADMTVLSSCNSARGENRSGEGMVGLTWALFVAGSRSQVVSQWSVDDASTAKLMGRFYSNLKKGRFAKDDALREAEKWLRRQDRKYLHPYYWAPFIVMGDWRP